MDVEPVVPANVQPLEHRFVPQGTVLVNVRYLLRRKTMTTLQRNVWHRQHDDHMRQNLRVLSSGAQPDVMSGGIKAAVTIQSAEKEVAVTKERVGGLTTSLVSSFSDLSYS